MIINNPLTQDIIRDKRERLRWGRNIVEDRKKGHMLVSGEIAISDCF